MLDLLRQVPLFGQLTDEQLQWINLHCQQIDLAAGELLFAEGSPATYFYVLLTGKLQITKIIGQQEMLLTQHQAGMFTGEIPLLTGTPYIANAYTVQKSHLLRMAAADFQTMLSVCSPVAGILLPIIAQRIQSMTTLTQQREKLAGLGKLAAGLAHELNNPAAAARRAAGQLHEIMQQQQFLALQLNEHLTAAQLTWLKTLLDNARAYMQQGLLLDALIQSDKEEELNTWLDKYDVTDGWKLAPILVNAGLDTSQLDDVVVHAADSNLALILSWLEATLSMDNLVHEIELSTERVSTLVKAIKDYSYMDQAPQQEVDIHEGLESTLTILGYKLKGAIDVVREYDRSLPHISVYGSELNQVWTNIIDNAIDALHGQGQIRLRTTHEAQYLLVEITDNGPGIPAAIQTHIFEPFFTTKGVGEGTGLGLDIVQRIIVVKHHGDIAVTSKPGETCFQIRLPMVLQSPTSGTMNEHTEQ